MVVVDAWVVVGAWVVVVDAWVVVGAWRSRSRRLVVVVGACRSSRRSRRGRGGLVEITWIVDPDWEHSALDIALTDSRPVA